MQTIIGLRKESQACPTVFMDPTCTRSAMPLASRKKNLRKKPMTNQNLEFWLIYVD